ncbi:helix-turn-helix domain-containing protein [Streptomyces sp. NPDC002952]|uniref:helix-turn-helix domain-containing protein n=1 Tax=Streptomyces sp. NPDC002952 TaxID=3364673 RepID=UPI0036B3F969
MTEMGRPETRIDPSEGPLQSFAYELRAIRRSAGNPSYRELASRANYSGTTLSEAARGLSLPSLEVTLAYVAACEGDVVFWRRYWKETDAALRTSEASGLDTSAILSEPVPAHTGMSRPAGSPKASDATSHGIRNPELKVILPALAGLAGATGMVGVAGLVGTKSKAAALTFVAGTCIASGFLLGRGLGNA